MCSHRKLELIGLTPPGLNDPAIAIAASRAGGVGILDLEYLLNPEEAAAAVARLLRYAGGRIGVKVGLQAEEWLQQTGIAAAECLSYIVLTPDEPEALEKRVRRLRAHPRTLLLETTCLQEARLAEHLGLDGVIVKGHEAGGRVGEETTYVLLQRLRRQTSLPLWAQGGIGLHTAAACYVAGAAGIVLDSQLLLTRESSLPESVKADIARMDGSETICLGSRGGDSYRVYDRPGLSATDALKRQLADLPTQVASPELQRAALGKTLTECIGWSSRETQIWLLGQDAAFAASLAERFQTVGGVLEAMRQAVPSHVRAAQSQQSLAENSPLALSHGTRYPVVQGPMTRVSDNAAFALKVAEGGGLPMLALALMRAPEVKQLLEETRQALGSHSWGVGILGFVPSDLRQKQMEVIRSCRPAFALIAGGRPDQARALEQAGIATYLHVPSPGLLRLFLEDGARRFVFEGRECGGHVGPRSSFVLWEMMIETLLRAYPGEKMEDCHVLFAGGIHDSVSAAMVASLSAPLAERGAKIGVLAGTAYLYTEEAVATGAIVPTFQQAALECAETIRLETGPGHATRCVPSPYVETFAQARERLLRENRPADEVRNALEALNLGRLRIASKGVVRQPQFGQAVETPALVTLSAAEQRVQGMYMIGQVAALHDCTCTVSALHHELSVGATAYLEAVEAPDLSPAVPTHQEMPCDIAIIGMSCLLPKAPDLQTYWNNIVQKVDAITEIPPDRWDWQRYFDADPAAADKIYSKWGGFLDDIPFDPMRYGMPPNTLPSIEPLQLLTLEAVRAVLDDAGYADRPFARQNTAVILGVSGGTGDLGQQYAIRSGLPSLVDAPAPEVLNGLPQWTEDSFPGILLNVAAGRVANRFDLGGVNYTVDAACASSLAALYLAVRELEAGTSDMVIAGGADTVQNPFAYLCFSKTHALSPRGRCRAFDDTADGIVISEGLAMLALKRLADAERDGDRIYAVIKAVGGSSDGRDKGLTAPRPEGQALALKRAYAKAGFSPATVGLIEAHGTGTVAGDQAEVTTLKRVFSEAQASRQQCAIGSVKSMIGHTKATAGMAGMIKVALSLHHKILPPTLNVERPNTKVGFSESPFYINSELRPWVQPDAGAPRRAGISAFGFGGTNFHAVLEEYTGDYRQGAVESALPEWPGELLLWTGQTQEEIVAKVRSLRQSLNRGAKPVLADLAYTLWQQARTESPLRLALVVESRDDLAQKLADVEEVLAQSPGALQARSGIYFSATPLATQGEIAFLFPGQGSQYPNMLRDLACAFPEVRQACEQADAVLAGRLPDTLSTFMFPPPAFTSEEQKTQQQALTQTNIAQPALGAISVGLCRLMEALDIQPAMVAGHSYGEYVALWRAGVFSAETLAHISEVRGCCIREASPQEQGTMAAVLEGRTRTQELLASCEDVWIANVNSPRQTVISGTAAGIDKALARLQENDIQARRLPVACAFHSPLVAPARDRLANALAALDFQSPSCPVFANASAFVYPSDSAAIRAMLSDHLVSPVHFADEVEAMYQAGARLFIEVGPRSVLTGLTEQILGDRPHVAVSLDAPGRSSLLPLLHALGQLAAQGVALNLDRLFAGRNVRRLNVALLEEETREKPLPRTAWLVNGGHARPLNAPQKVQTPPVAALSLPKVTDEAPHLMLSAPSVQRKDNSMESPIVPSTPIPSPAASNGHKAPIAAASSTPERGKAASETVMRDFQRVMQCFLETQQAVMSAYLRGSTETPPLPVPVVPLPESRPTPQPIAPLFRSLESVSPPESVSPLAPPIPASLQPAAPPESTRQEPVTRWNRLTLENLLVRLVGEKTGYPQEMLSLNANMEADLGIDSIKRVEILGALERQTGLIQEAMDQASRLQTLQSLLDFLTDRLPGEEREHITPLPPPNASITPAEDAPLTQKPLQIVSERTDYLVDGPGDANDIPRFLLSAVAATIAPAPSAPLTGQTFLITEDERGVSFLLAQELQRRGGRTVLVGMEGIASHQRPNGDTADLTDFASVESLAKRLQDRFGPISGLIHLLPLRDGTPFASLSAEEWQTRIEQEVVGLFHLTKIFSDDLKRASAKGSAWLMAACALGGTFAVGADTGEMFAGQGGVAGLVKALACEWPHVHCRVVDFERHRPPEEMASQISEEIAAPNESVEIGYRNGHRTTLRLRRSSADATEAAPCVLTPESVVLITGGARGITAQIARELAARFHPRLILVGRSPLPPAEEEPETARGITSQELKAALIARLRRKGQECTPAQVEAACTGLLREREIRANLKALEEQGCAVEYRRLDVRDVAAFTAAIEQIYQRYGRLDGVIHGAGLIEDRRIEDKSSASFRRVLETKTQSAFALTRALRSETLQFLVFFSSIAGRFGNRGQSDYAAANEILNKLAEDLDRRWPARVAAINWGPWQQAGMVSEAVQRQFEERGVQMIPVEAGCRHFMEELLRGRKGESEVILGNGPWEREAACEAASVKSRAADGEALLSDVPTEPERSFATQSATKEEGRREEESRPALPSFAIVGQRSPLWSAWPLLQESALTRPADGSALISLALDPATTPYLNDHRLDGQAVFPLAMAAELMAEAAQSLEPNREVVSLRSLRLLRGLILKERQVIHIAIAASSPDTWQVAVRLPERPEQPCYTAFVEMGALSKAASPLEEPSFPPLAAFPMTLRESYEEWLFQGPCWQSIRTIEGIDNERIAALLMPSSPVQLLGHATPGHWLFDPALLDGSFQMAILWERFHHRMTPLPAGFAALHRRGVLFSETPIRCQLTAQSSLNGHSLRTDTRFLNTNGQTLAWMEAMEFSGSEALNRLATSARSSLERTR